MVAVCTAFTSPAISKLMAMPETGTPQATLRDARGFSCPPLLIIASFSAVPPNTENHTGQGWSWLNLGSLAPVLLTGAALLWLAWQRRAQPATA